MDVWVCRCIVVLVCGQCACGCILVGVWVHSCRCVGVLLCVSECVGVLKLVWVSSFMDL